MDKHVILFHIGCNCTFSPSAVGQTVAPFAMLPSAPPLESLVDMHKKDAWQLQDQNAKFWNVFLPQWHLGLLLAPWLVPYFCLVSWLTPVLALLPTTELPGAEMKFCSS